MTVLTDCCLLFSTSFVIDKQKVKPVIFSVFKREQFDMAYVFPSNSEDDSIYTRNLFIIFVVSLLILILSALFEYFFYIRKSFDGPIYKQRQTIRFRIKKWAAKILLKFKTRNKTPAHLIDKLVIFNDADKSVRFTTSNQWLKTQIYNILVVGVEKCSPSMPCISIPVLRRMAKFCCLQRRDDETDS